MVLYYRKELAWSVFVTPFTRPVWLALALNALVATLVIRVAYTRHIWSGPPLVDSGITRDVSSCVVSQVMEVLSLCWSLHCSYLGKPLPPHLHAGSKTSLAASSVRMSTFLAAFCGVIVWCAYRASLTSELVNQVYTVLTRYMQCELGYYYSGTRGCFLPVIFFYSKIILLQLVL